MDLRDIQNLIKFVAKSGASEVKLEMEDIKITIKTGTEKTETTIVQQAPMNLPQMAVTPSAAQVAESATEDVAKAELTKYKEITSPIL